MAPIIEKRVIQQQPPNEQSSMIASTNKEGSNGTVGVTLTTATTKGAVQTFVQNSSNHSHGHGHGHHQAHSHNTHHSNHHHQHAKENTATNTTTNNRLGVNGLGNKKGIEILDFHESWREEVEMYKDAMYVKKHIPQQLLGSHNHVHTPQGCQLEMSNNNAGANKISHVVKPYNNNVVNSIGSVSSSSSSPTSVKVQTNGIGGANGVGGATATSNAKSTNENKSRVRVAATALSEELGESTAYNQVSNVYYTFYSRFIYAFNVRELEKYLKSKFYVHKKVPFFYKIV